MEGNNDNIHLVKDILNEFELFYNNYTTTNYNATNEKIVGYIGSDVPEELLIAGGFLPIRIRGNPSSDCVSVAEQYLERGFDPVSHAQFGSIINKSYENLSHIIISNSSDAIIRIYYYLRALKQVEPNLNIPNVYFVDFLHTKFRMSALYNRERIKAFKENIEKWTNRKLHEEDIARAIEICNENRSLLREVAKLRKGDIKLSGTQALKIIGSSMLMDKRKHNELLNKLLNNKDQLPTIDNPKAKLFVTGSTHDHSEFYEMVESTGAIIVGEDHEIGRRIYSNDIDIDAGVIDGIVDRYHLRDMSTHQGTVSERVDTLVKNVIDSGANGVVFYIHKSDDAPSWDFPEQKKALEKEGIQTLLIDRQSYTLSDKAERDVIQRKISNFVSGL